MSSATMNTYEYTVRDKRGGKVTGRLEAPTQEAVAQKLRSQGLAPINIRRADSGLQREIRLPGSDRVPMKDLAVMSRQFSVMIESGLSLLRALNILATQTENKALAKVLGEVRTDVEGGSSLSAALAKRSQVFPPLMVNMCRAGEVGGFLDKVLVQIANNLEAEVRLRGKIKSAMTYPSVVFGISILSVIGMLLFIVPTFSNMFASLGGTLPLPTRILVWMSHAMRWGLPLLIVLAIGGFFGWRKIKNDERVRRAIDPWKLKVPVFGPLFKKVAISRFTRNLGTMLAAGVPILRSLEIVGQASGNIVISDAAKSVEDSVRRGDSLAAPLADSGVFPPMVVQMLAVGEDTGAMDTMLHKVSDFYDQEVETATEALTSLIEPLMIAVLGAIIGGMIIALYMPIFGVFNLIK
ncbi:type II secretion system F family protein [Spongisporangium articulatum]|uniref:Type II secretion system F family protein n=1 Tax=Spongisporangium articulatum TaxID=3362603 RepID=A0ABW8AR71_9ACTN